MRTARAIVIAHAIVLGVGCTRAVEQPPARPPNILLITIDTFRADRMGSLTPALNRLSKAGVRFTTARSTAPLTLPAHASIMTGLLPPAHGARLNGIPMGKAAQTMATRLQRTGYRTGAVVGAFVLDRRFGLAEGFELYDDRITRDPGALDQLQAERPANVVVDSAISWLQDVPRDRPWFLWVHMYDPHAPYNAPGGREANASLTNAYDAEVAFADSQLNRLLEAANGHGDASNSSVIVLGDHGESLGEHTEVTHGMLLFDPALRVPLVMTAPGTTPGVRDDPASIVDVLPTILAIARQPADTTLPGRNLLESPDRDRELYAETEYPTVAGWRPARALLQDRWKLIASTRAKLFDITADPAESTDLAASRTSIVQAMQKRLDELSAAKSAKERGPAIDADTAARLRALGYVAPASTAPTTASGVDAADVVADWAQFEHALTALTSGRPKEASPTFEALARKHPAGAIFQTTHARTLLQLGRTREALAIYQQAVARWPADGSLYHELSVAAREAGDRSEAARAEEAALAITPDLPAAQNGRGLLHADAGELAQAAQRFQQAVKLDPTNASYMANLGNAQRAIGQLDAAAQSYRHALARDPSLAEAANGLGVVLVQQRRAPEAMVYLEQAIKADPSFGEAQLNLGIALQQSGQRQRAIAQYQLVEHAAFASRRDREAARTLRRELEGR